MTGSTFWNAVATLLLVALVDTNNADPDLKWGKLCPVACSCHLGHSADLPIKQWMQREENKETSKPPPSATNEAFYEDATHNIKGELMKIAICIFQSSSDPQKLLQKLPGDTQALTILQSRGSEEITIEATHTKHFQQLIFLDIQGYFSEVRAERKENLQDHKLMLSNNGLRPVTSLKYLSLQHITILPGSLMSNEIDHVGYSVPQFTPHDNEIPTNPQTERGRKFRRPNKGPIPNLIFVNSNTSQNELVPYKIYKEQKERARLSIFLGLINLELLRVIDCGLHEVYWEMFHGLSKIEYLSLEKNELLFLPEFAFYGTPHLKVLSLAHNKLLNIQSTGLAGLLELQVLDLSHNNFSHLSEFSLPPFPNLQAAYLWHNPIETVFASTFEIMNATTALYLGGDNSPLELHPSSFQGLIRLRKLVLLSVGIEILEREQLTGMPQLRSLKMTGEISSISFDAFLDVSMLETLDLHNCNIKYVSMDAFYGLYRLSVLDLSNNLLESLPLGVFDQQFSLKELYLQNNSLTELPDGFFTSLPAKIVRLDGNLWHCTCNMKNWVVAVTNRVKEFKSTTCQHEYDKGVKCQSQEVIYIYEKKVAPQCHTPEKYRGWGVYQVLRKELRCGKSQHKKFNRKEYLKKKYKEYEKTNTQSDKNDRVTYNKSETDKNYKFSQITKNLTLSLPTERMNKNMQKSVLTQDKKEIRNTIRDEIPKYSANPDAKSKTPIAQETPFEKNSYLDNSNNSEQEVIDNTLLILPRQTHQIKPIPHKDVKQAPQSAMHTIPKNQLHKTIYKKRKQPVQESEEPPLTKPALNDEHKQLKKIWKSDQQRKHQEKLKNFMESS